MLASKYCHTFVVSELITPVGFRFASSFPELLNSFSGLIKWLAKFRARPQSLWRISFSESAAFHWHIWLWRLRPETSESGCGRTFKLTQTCTGNTGLTQLPLRHTVQKQSRQTGTLLHRYSHLGHDLVQEDAIHQLHEHVDALLWAHVGVWTQRTQCPNLERQRERGSTTAKQNKPWKLLMIVFPFSSAAWHPAQFSLSSISLPA